MSSQPLPKEYMYDIEAIGKEDHTVVVSDRTRMKAPSPEPSLPWNGKQQKARATGPGIWLPGPTPSVTSFGMNKQYRQRMSFVNTECLMNVHFRPYF